MSYGMEIQNTAGRIQVGGDLGNPRLIQSGTMSGSGGVTMPYPIEQEPPLVLVRPSAANVWVGGYITVPSASGTNGSISIKSTGSFNYAIFSTKGTATSDGATHGLEVYRPDGTVAYSSRHQHPRITQLFTRPVQPVSNDGGYPTNFALTGFTAMPWILLNPLILTFYGVGEFTEQQGAVFAKVNSTFTTMTIDILSVITNPPKEWGTLTGGTWYRTDFDPYKGRKGYFGVGTYG